MPRRPGTPGPLPRRRHAGIVAWLAALTAPLALALACLPDLELPVADEGAEAGPPPAARTPLSLCGDGLIATLDDGGDAGESCDPGEGGAPFGCAGCRIVCPGVVDERTGHCFYDAGLTASFSTAARLCDGEGAHLATFASAREARVLGDASVWIGFERSPLAGGDYLSVKSDEPGWPCPGCFALRADAAPGPVFPELPDAAPGECVASVGGAWYGVPCEDAGSSHVALCEREPVGRRGQGCGGAICFTLPATAGDKTYVLFANPEGPDVAARTCGAYPDGKLAILDTAEEREQLAREVVKYLPTSLTTTLWVGLSLDAETSTWRWDDGMLADGISRPDPWAKGQPQGSGAGRAFLKMRDRRVDTQLAASEDERPPGPRPFVCQRTP